MSKTGTNFSYCCKKIDVYSIQLFILPVYERMKILSSAIYTYFTPENEKVQNKIENKWREFFFKNVKAKI